MTSKPEIDHAEMPKPVLGQDWIEAPYRMKSGRPSDGDPYRIAVSKDGKTIWCYQKDVAAPIYCSGGKGSQGFGGSPITFQLEDYICGSITLKGPWSSNTDAFFHDTGIDYRSKHYSFVVIGLGWRHEIDERGQSGRCIVENVVYADKEPTQGPFDRATPLGKEWANKLGKPVYVHRSSYGGGGRGYEYPDGWTKEMQNAFHESLKPKWAKQEELRKEAQAAWVKANPPPPLEDILGDPEEWEDPSDYYP